MPVVKHRFLQALVCRDWLVLGSKTSVVCVAEVSLQLSASNPIHSVASQQREKIHPSFPLLSAVQMVAAADCSRVPLVGCPPSPRRPTAVEVGGAGTGWVPGPGTPRTRYRRSCTTRSSCKAPSFLSRAWGEQPPFDIKTTQAASSEPTSGLVQF